MGLANVSDSFNKDEVVELFHLLEEYLGKHKQTIPNFSLFSYQEIYKLLFNLI